MSVLAQIRYKLFKDVRISIPIGELVDRITILQLKRLKIKGEQKVKAIEREFQNLHRLAQSLGVDFSDVVVQELQEVNTELWEKEDLIREKGSCTLKDAVAVLGMKIADLNDRRSRLKNRLNETWGCKLVEAKHYE